MFSSSIIFIKKPIFLLILFISVIFLPNRLATFALLNYANLFFVRGKNVIWAYQQALFLSPNNAQVRWQVMRAALADDNETLAAQAVAPLLSILKNNPLLFADGLRSLELAGKTSELLTLYENNRDLEHSSLVSDTVALAYIAEGKLDKALVLRPEDLYLNVYLWQYSKMSQKVNLTNPIRSKLKYFSNSAIEPSNVRILSYTAKAILQLYEYGVWSREEVARVIAYLIWKHSDAVEIELLLKTLSMHYPTESIWSDLAVELVQRKEQKSSLVPTRLALNISKAGNNLVRDTKFNSFNEIARAKGNVFWHWGLWQGKENSDALFMGGTDYFESDSALRLTNLWLRPTQVNTIPPYAEYVSEGIILDPNVEYVLALRYKTDQLGSATAFVALLDYTATPHFVFTHTTLPPTMGDWQVWQTLGKSYTKPVKVQLLVRMSGVGSVWFDDIQLAKANTH